MSEFLTSTELYINMKNPPVYDRTKDYWDQSADILQFYSEELRKITEGVNIGGYYMHPWLYFHINYFKSPIPTMNSRGVMVDVIRNPPLDDNFLYTVENYGDAEKLNQGMILFGTRGATKSVILGSNTHWTAITKPGGVMSINGGDAKDLNDIVRMFSTSFENINPAFELEALKTETNLIEVGMRLKNQTKYYQSYINVTNADPKSGSKDQKGAGGSPSHFIVDEIGKFDCMGLLSSALPSFRTPYGYRLVPLLAGTSGNDVLSKDAKKILENPAAYGMLAMNWDRLERGIREEDITWGESKKNSFSVFMPGQMSYRLESPKIVKSLSEVLGIKSEHLSKIKINCTDWNKANLEIEKLIDIQTDQAGRDLQRMYYPRTVEDVFLTKGSNPFPRSVIERQIKRLEEEGNTGRPIELVRDGVKTVAEFSDKKRAPLFYTGGEVDSPVFSFDAVPEFQPEKYTYVSGLDSYKLDGAALDGSLGSLYVIRRRGLTFGSPCEVVVASYSARPNTQKEFNQNVEKVVKSWNSECCIESVDLTFQQYMDGKNIADEYLCPAFGFTLSKDGKKAPLNSRYGLYPTTNNNKVRMDRLIEWAKEQHTVGIDADGNEITKYSVEFINDVDLLREMLDYRKGGNYDRIAAFSHALVYAQELDKEDVLPERPKKVQKDGLTKKRVQHSGPYGSRRHNPY